MIIVIADKMEEEAIEELKKLGTVVYKPENLNASMENADILIVRSATQVTKELISHAKKLRIVARAGIGLDNVDQEACKNKGIKVINTPGASTNAVAELVIGIMISSMRGVQKAHYQMKNKIWDKKNLVGNEIEGKTLGIIGYGRIGSSVGKKAHVLGMKIISYNPPPRHQDELVKYIENLDEFLAQSDVITIHVPLIDSTKNLIDKKAFEKMKENAIVINTSRGGIIDEEALYDACKSKKIMAAALDVYSTEPYIGKLLELENVYFTPHIGAGTKEAQERIAKELVQRIKKELDS
ncbi:hydroxyacid dehydrogenase [Candidatus Micrarchaeota archaeon]|nr:hydroxyacid dehydrogenase [Candidatus Micrarchaeota archaeon]MBU1165454.1 hydroxyacid dehydrogenase [Candidatus Micrarchaeota archaeon]MBU1887435.1 hydroxyacid dehydrogenase [Candidatus Micrarchaeota archaeon]